MKKTSSIIAPFIIILTLAVILFWLRKNGNNEAEKTVRPSSSSISTRRGLNRHPAKISYSKHARCRMGCRHITEAEIKEVLEDGKINYNKSELQTDDCHKRYAVDDVANNQHIRIVVAQCSGELTVITCIDLDKEWTCDCE